MTDQQTTEHVVAPEQPTAGAPPAERAPAGPSPDRPGYLEVKDLSVRFERQHETVYAVNGLSYRVAPGSTVAIIGESGSGKTVGARAILGLLPSYATITGSARFDGEEMVGVSRNELRRHRGAHVAMIFQDSARSLNPTIKIGKQIVEGIRTHEAMSKDQAKTRAIELLRMVRIPEAEKRFASYPHQLSGGMRQRVMTAIALSSNPRVLIADEATTALDVTTQAQIMEMLLDVQSRLNMSLIMISHDMGLAASYTSQVIVMYGGKVVEQAATTRLFDNPRMPYTRSLLDAIPRLELPPHSGLRAVPGQPPNLTSIPSSCSFSPRCPYATDVCNTTVPPLAENEHGDRWACFHPLGTGEGTT